MMLKEIYYLNFAWMHYLKQFEAELLLWIRGGWLLLKISGICHFSKY